MNKASRLILFSLILTLLLFIGLIFSAWIVPNLIMPVALSVWLFLRLFILSVNQIYFWWLLTAAATAWAFYRLLHSEGQVEHKEYNLPSDALRSWKFWQENLRSAKSESYERSRIQQELIVLLMSLYASRQSNLTQVEILQAIENRQLPLPERFYNLLFSPKPEKAARRSPQAYLQASSRFWQQWYSKLTGREQAEYEQTVDELIKFMENTLES